MTLSGSYATPAYRQGQRTSSKREYSNQYSPESSYNIADARSPVKYDPTAGSRPSPYTPNQILDALIRAGLGDTPQTLITPDQISRALAGEQVQLSRAQRWAATLAARKAVKESGDLSRSSKRVILKYKAAL